MCKAFFEHFNWVYVQMAQFHKLRMQNSETKDKEKQRNRNDGGVAVSLFVLSVFQ